MEFIKQLPQEHYGLKKLIKKNYKRIDFDKLKTTNLITDGKKIENLYILLINEILFTNTKAFEMLKYLSVINTKVDTNINKSALENSYKSKNFNRDFEELLKTGLIKEKEGKVELYEFAFPYLQEVLEAHTDKKSHEFALQYYETKTKKINADTLDKIEILYHKVKVNPTEILINEFLSIANSIDQLDERHKRLINIGLELLIFEDKYKAPILFMLGNIISTIGNPEDAERIYLKAINIFKKLAKKYYRIYLPYIAAIQKNLGTLYTDLKRFEEAEKIYSNALNSYKEIESNYYNVYSPDFDTKEYSETEESYNNDLKTYTKLLEKKYDIYLPEEPSTTNDLGNVCIDLDLLEDLQDGSIDSLDNYKKLAHICYHTYLVDIAKTESNLGIIYTNLRRYEEAEKMHLEALKIKRKVAEVYPEQVLPELAYTFLDLGDLYASLDRFQEAEPMFNDALRISKKLVKENPEVYMYNTALIQNSLGIIYTRLKNYELAEKMYLDALKTFRIYAKEKPNPYIYNVADVQNNLGNMYLILRNLEKAQYYLNKAFKKDPNNPIILYNIACLESLTNNPTKALELLTKLIAIDYTYIERIKSDDNFDNIKDLEEFKELIRK
ncbi:MAG: tetratricopeptide repeat protein [Promethearchaeota archaeon]